MPMIGWQNDRRLADTDNLTCCTRDYPGEESHAPAPLKAGEVRFNKIEQEGKRYLDIAALVDGRPVHHVLDRDSIEKLRAFLAVPTARQEGR